jgi:hypothetical protein
MQMSETSKFKVEREVYKVNLQMWLTEGLAGHFVVIKGDEIIGTFSSADSAFLAGVEKCGENNFFMSSILPTDATNVSFIGLAV